MSNIAVVNQYSTPAEGIKFANYAELITWLEKNHTSYLPGEHLPVNGGNTTPAPEDQDRPWIRTNADGSPDRTYNYFNGNWVARNPAAPSTSARILWVGTLVDLRSYDGGDGTSDVPTATTGAMWEEDILFRDRIPMGVKDTDGTVLTALALAGAKTDSFTLTNNNLPRHRHEITVEGVGDTEGAGDLDDPTSTGYVQVGAGTEVSWTTSSRDVVGHTRNYGKATPDSISLDTVPPVIGNYFIKRTARIYYLPGA